MFHCKKEDRGWKETYLVPRVSLMLRRRGRRENLGIRNELEELKGALDIHSPSTTPQDILKCASEERELANARDWGRYHD